MSARGRRMIREPTAPACGCSRIVDMRPGPSQQSALDGVLRLSGPPIEDRLQDSLRTYWLERAAQHNRDSYAGVPLAKFPEDLRVYEHLLWADRPDVVIEIGTYLGASALWFRDRLRTLAEYGHISEPRVITVDIDVEPARSHLDRADPDWERQIALVRGDVADEQLPELVAELLPQPARCMVVEDSAHLYATTMAALCRFAQFVPVGGYFVVEDGCVDIEQMRLEDDWPRGVLPAVEEWLSSEGGKGFVQRRDLELYRLTCHPGGLLQRVGTARV
jgi:cephalosporin hydroxylase